MLNEVPKYHNKHTDLNLIFKKFKKKDREIIEKFMVLLKGTAGKTTSRKYWRLIIKITDTFQGDLDKISLDRLREFNKILNNSDLMIPTRNELKKVLKRFLREQYEDWNTRFKGLKDIKLDSESRGNQDKINANTILREEDINLLITGIENLRYKAMILLFYESAGRPQEIINLKWGDLDLNKKSVKLHSFKTGDTRVNPIEKSIVLLKRWKAEYPFPNPQIDDWVFPSFYKREEHQSSVSMTDFVRRAGERILKRKIFPYLIRHSRATQLQKILPAKVYEKFMNHSIETATRYSHLDAEDVRDIFQRDVYGIEEISEERKHELEKKIEFLEGKFKKKMAEAEEDYNKKLESFEEALSGFKGLLIKANVKKNKTSS